MIVIGLGSGRTGTASLAKLLSNQTGGLCFHEMNPACVRHAGTPQAAINMVREFQAILDGGPRHLLAVDFSRQPSADGFDRLQGMDRVALLGDVAFYHLRYVEDMIALGHPIRFVCIWRARAEVVESYLEKTRVKRWRSKIVADRLASLITREPYHVRRNPWMDHDGREWRFDPVWDKCFPNFEASGPEDALGQYWDYYYQEADRLAAAHPTQFRIFDIKVLSDETGQRDILRFCGIDEGDQTIAPVHLHKKG